MKKIVSILLCVLLVGFVSFFAVEYVLQTLDRRAASASIVLIETIQQTYIRSGVFPWQDPSLASSVRVFDAYTFDSRDVNTLPSFVSDVSAFRFHRLTISRPKGKDSDPIVCISVLSRRYRQKNTDLFCIP